MRDEYRGAIMVTVELPVQYTVRFGLNPIVTYAQVTDKDRLGVPAMMLPTNATMRIMDACIEAARDQERGLSEVDPLGEAS